MNSNNNKYVIGIDGGATKTIAVLADLNGRILNIARAGSSSPRNIGAKKAADNIAEAIYKFLKKNKKEIISTYIGLPSIVEQPHFQKQIRKELQKYRKISIIFKGKVFVGSDQAIAFKTGTDKNEGLLLSAGTGCVARGWRKNKDEKASGWGWLADEGSAFWVGQKVFQIILQELDGRGPKTLLTKMVFQEFKIKNTEDLINFVYSKNPTEIIPKFSIVCDKAAKKGDRIARNIMIEAGEELALSANAVIRKLNFQKEKFPLVLVGSMFKSSILLGTVKKEIRKFAPKVEFIRPKSEPVAGAVKLAIEALGNPSP